MEPHSDSNPAQNLRVYVWSGTQPRASYPFGVLFVLNILYALYLEYDSPLLASASRLAG